MRGSRFYDQAGVNGTSLVPQRVSAEPTHMRFVTNPLPKSAQKLTERREIRATLTGNNGSTGRLDFVANKRFVNKNLHKIAIAVL